MQDTEKIKLSSSESNETTDMNSSLNTTETNGSLSTTATSASHPNTTEDNDEEDEGVELSRNSINVKGDSAKTLSAFPGGKSSAADISSLKLKKVPSVLHKH